LLREKRALFRNANCSPEEQLEFLLRLTDDDVLVQVLFDRSSEA
jgi:hypothetical protein